MTKRIPTALRRVVRERAGGWCEYCLCHEQDAVFSHEPDHIIAAKHGGPTVAANLAWTCFVCNRFKGSDLASIDSRTNQLTRLFHPRSDAWKDHFRLTKDGRIVPLTAVGRVTAALLRLNLPSTVALRRRRMKSIRFRLGR